MALDTSVWIYHFEGSVAYGQAADSVLEAVTQARIGAVASELVLLELLVAPLKKGSQDVADEIELALLHFPHLQLAPVTRAVLIRAAEIRARYGLRTPDAIMLATAVESGATLAVTNDSAWRKVNEIEVLLLRDLKI
jgi:predicted nucleic acid-binding protein